MHELLNCWIPHPDGIPVQPDFQFPAFIFWLTFKLNRVGGAVSI
jgi:hypothetical protein